MRNTLVQTLLVVVGISWTSYVYAGPSDKTPQIKSKPVELQFWQAFCGKQNITYNPSATKDDCRNKCSASSTCQYASYDSDKKQCGMVPASYDCTFARRSENNWLLGYEKKVFNNRNGLDRKVKLLVDSKHAPVLETAMGVGDEQCVSLCSIHPKCKVAVVESGPHGPITCSLKASAGVVKKLGGMDAQGYQMTYVAA